MSDNDERNEFSHWLADAMVSTQGNPAFRDSVINQSVSVLRWRRRAKRVGLVGALAGCYVAGMLTMAVVRESNSVPNLANATMPLAPGSAGGSERDNALPASEKRELELTVAKLTPYDRLRQLGDRQLSDETDIPGAIRTYRKALQVASADQMALSLDQDTWLLMALKTDQSNP